MKGLMYTFAALAVSLIAGTAHAQFLQVPTGVQPGYGWAVPRRVMTPMFGPPPIWFRQTAPVTPIQPAPPAVAANVAPQPAVTDKTGAETTDENGVAPEDTNENTEVTANNGLTGYNGSTGYGPMYGYTYIQPGATNQTYGFNGPPANIGIRPMGGIIQPHAYGWSVPSYNGYTSAPTYYNGYGGY